MKIISKSADRVIAAYFDNNVVTLIERTYYLPPGYSRRKSNEYRIALTLDELTKLVEAFPASE